LRVLFDKNVPSGVRHFLLQHEVHTFVAMGWHPQLENGELVQRAEESGFDVMVTCDQSIQYQQNLSGRKFALVVLGSNIWPIVRGHGTAIAAAVDAAKPGSFDFIEMPMPLKSRPRK
jgi:hypothetical protein